MHKLFVLSDGGHGTAVSRCHFVESTRTPVPALVARGQTRRGDTGVEHPQVPAQPLSCSAQCWQLWPEADTSLGPILFPLQWVRNISMRCFLPGSH